VLFIAFCFKVFLVEENLKLWFGTRKRIVQSGNGDSCVRRRKSAFRRISCLLGLIVWFFAVRVLLSVVEL